MQRINEKVGGLEESLSRLELESDNLKPLLKIAEQLGQVTRQETNVRNLMKKSAYYEDRYTKIDSRLATLDKTIAGLGKQIDSKVSEETGGRLYETKQL